MSDSDTNNVIDKARHGINSTVLFLYAIPILLGACIMVSVFMNGLQNTGAGKIIGDSGESGGGFIDDIYCSWKNLDPCPGAGTVFRTWWNTDVRKKTEVDVQGNPLPELPTDGTPVPSDEPTEAPTEPPAVVPTEVVYPQEMIDAVSAVLTDWVASKNTQFAGQQLDLIQAKWPNESRTYLPYLDLREKVKDMGEIVQAFFAAQETAMSGNATDMATWTANAGAYHNSCLALAAETSSLTTNGYASLTQGCTANSSAMITFASSYANTTLEQAPDAWLANMGGIMQSTQWTVIMIDDRGGSCHCATLKGSEPVFFNNLEIQVPAAVLEQLLPDKFGLFAESLVGQTLLWP